MKIVYATDINAANIHNWSGLGWYYRNMLEQAGYNVTVLDKSDMPLSIFQKIRTKLIQKTQRRLYAPRFSVSVSKYYARQIHNKVAAGNTVISPNTVVLAYLKQDLKKVLYADATFDSLLRLYPKYKEHTKQCIIQGEIIDRQAIANSDLLIYTSQWAADSAINHYGADPKKIAIVPFGANLDLLPSAERVEQGIANRLKNDHINLLFLGIDWVRKGGDYALKVVTKLNESGIPATLHIVGATNLPPKLNETFIIDHGFVSKSTAEGQRYLGALLLISHFLLLPTLADCTPVACSEAGAFGVPCITSDVGGLSSIIKSNINGHTFSHDAFVDNAVAYISKLVTSDERYKELCYSSYDYYLKELNWGSVGRKIARLVNNI